jgi:biopolymer transport protein TolR
MATSLIGQSVRGGGRRRTVGRFTDINVTPMVDVMLVLLIVFMVTAPLLTVGVPVDLPKTQAATINERDEPLVITVNAAGNIYIQETQVAPDQLVPRLEAITRNKPDLKIYVRGDRAVAYGRIMEVMGLVSAAGYSKVALLAELPQQSSERRRR